MKIRVLATFLLVGLNYSYSQKNIDLTSPLVYLDKGYQEYEAGNYDKSIEAYSKILVNDTSYAVAQYEISLCYYALEDYKKTQEILREILDYNIRFDFKHKVYLMLGSALVADEKPQEAIDLYTEVLEKYPYQQNVYYARAYAYIKQEKFDLAKKDYMNSIQSNIFYPDAHLQLGLMAANQGYYGQALMSLITFAYLSPDDSRTPEVVSIIENLANRTFEPDRKDFEFYPDGEDPFEEYNILFDNKVAIQKKYKTDFTIPTSLGNQLHLLLKTEDYKENDTEFWNTFYMKFLKSIWKNDEIDMYVLTCLVSIDNPTIQKKISSKLNKLKTFYGQTMKRYQTLSSNQYINFEGEQQWVQVSYIKSHMEYLGKTKDDLKTPIGNYHYFHPSGLPSMTIQFDDNGKAVGTWEFYDEFDGTINRKVTFTDVEGETIQMNMHPSGELALKYRQIGDFAVDTVTKYYRNGSLQEQYLMKDGKFNGFYKNYYENGVLSSSYNYVNGKLEGNYDVYHSNGKASHSATFVADKISGVKKVYYADGNLKEESEFLDGELNGKYTAYYSNGNIKDTRLYKEGKQIGKSISYFSNGVIQSEAILDETGKENGITIWYDIDGKKYHEFEYVKGDLKTITFFNKKGEAEVLATKKGKKIDYISKFSNGETSKKVSIVDGMYEGPCEYYDYYGNLNHVELYKKNVLVDSIVDYFANGKIKSITPIKDGYASGLYLEYNVFGDLIREGLYYDGDYNKEWFGYYFDGAKEYESYFINGNRHGYQLNYSVDGKINNLTEYDKGNIIANVYFDTNEVVMDRFGEFNDEVLIHDQSNSFIRYKGQYKNGNADGLSEWFFQDGEILTRGSYVNDEQTGEWKWYHVNGKVEIESNFLNGLKHGAETYYYMNGAKKSVYHYDHGNLEGEHMYWYPDGKIYMKGNYLNDERHGKWSYFNPQGELFLIRYYDQGIFASYTYLDKAGNEVPQTTLEKNELVVKSYFKNGKLAHEHKRVNGEIEGPYKTYYSNGQIYEDNMFELGEQVGKNYEYYSNGQKMKEEDWVKGELHGQVIEYYQNGNKKTEGTYLYSSKHGDFYYYDETGKMTHHYVYYDDKIVGHEAF